jgi:hypothetical protein
MLMTLSDDRLVDAMRAFVTATNRVQHLEGRPVLDMHQLDEATTSQREAATALQEALVQRGWRRPGT